MDDWKLVSPGDVLELLCQNVFIEVLEKRKHFKPLSSMPDWWRNLWNMT